MSRMQDRKKEDRPREKLAKKGAAALSDYELLMATIGSGNKQADVTQIARDVKKLVAEKGSSDSDSILDVEKHVYDLLRYDSKNERKFAQALETSSEVFVYAKLPTGFKIPTPVGNYNPDWAIVFESGTVKHVYFIAETKGSMSTLQLKGAELLKIDYAREHFKLLEEENVKYDVVDGYETLLDIVR